MNLESLETLLGWRKHNTCADGYVRIIANQAGFETQRLDEIIDAIQAEVDERFMELPLDADGVPIRPGDQMTDYSKRVDGHGIAKWDVVSVNECAFFDMSHGLHIANQHHHVKPRTVEDVLWDAVNGTRNAYTHPDGEPEEIPHMVEELASELNAALGRGTYVSDLHAPVINGGTRERVVRCGDCARLNTTDCPCNQYLSINADGYCAWVVKRKEGDDD